MSNPVEVEIIDAVLSDLLDRSGVGNELEAIREDEGVWREMNATLQRIVREKLNGAKSR